MSDISADSLLQYAEDESTYFIEFNRRCTHYGTTCIYCFVENYDLCFYPHRVSDIRGQRVEGIPCDGKKNVIKVFELIRSKPEYDKYITLFFVDADFDDNSQLDSRIYVTSRYSVENFFMDEDVISRTLENEYQLRPNAADGKHSLCLDLYRKELSDFHSAVLPFNSWLHAVKNKGLRPEMKVKMGDSVPAGLIDLTIGSIKPLYKINELESKYPLAPKLTEEELKNSCDFLGSHLGMIRGKYEIQFLNKFFEFLNSDSKGPRNYTVSSKGVNMDKGRMISILDNYVLTPPDLREYILTGVRRIA